MLRGLMRNKWFWTLFVMLSAEMGLYFALVGWPSTPRPSTPMTVARANHLFGQAFQLGQSRHEVEHWLDSQGFPVDAGAFVNHTSYAVLRRSDTGASTIDWMDGIGRQTVAECASLKVDAVHSIIRVRYPDAEHYSSGQTEIRVYLFFDSGGRLLRHWVSESHLGL